MQEIYNKLYQSRIHSIINKIILNISWSHREGIIFKEFDYNSFFLNPIDVFFMLSV